MVDVFDFILENGERYFIVINDVETIDDENDE